MTTNNSEYSLSRISHTQMNVQIGLYIILSLKFFVLDHQNFCSDLKLKRKRFFCRVFGKEAIDKTIYWIIINTIKKNWLRLFNKNNLSKDCNSKRGKCLRPTNPSKGLLYIKKLFVPAMTFITKTFKIGYILHSIKIIWKLGAHEEAVVAKILLKNEH